MNDVRLTTSRVPARRQRRGAILIIAMIVIFALASLVLVLGQSMRAEAGASANRASAEEAAAIARGAEQYVLALLSETDVQERADLDESAFAAVPVGQGYFWVVRPPYDDPSVPAYGLVDESSKLSLNAESINVERLMYLPGMTDEIAASIVDWRDEDEDLTAGGAENQNYLALPEPYHAKNGDFETVEELLLVRGMTRELLYGPVSAMAVGAGDLPTAGQTLAGEYYQQHGLFDFFTVWSTPASSTTSSGEEKININSAEGKQQLITLMQNTLGAARAGEISGQFSPGNLNVPNLLAFASRYNVQASELQQLEDSITAGAPQPGSINLNAAPREVLLCLSGLTESDVDALLAAREAAVASNPTSIAWVLDVLKAKVNDLGNGITGAGGHYSADIVAAAGNGRAFKRVRIVVDTTAAPPRIVYRRDLTDQGWPLDPSILAALRAGDRPAFQ